VKKAEEKERQQRIEEEKKKGVVSPKLVETKALLEKLALINMTLREVNRRIYSYYSSNSKPFFQRYKLMVIACTTRS
jgi:hypothetical protein